MYPVSAMQGNDNSPTITSQGKATLPYQAREEHDPCPRNFKMQEPQIGHRRDIRLGVADEDWFLFVSKTLGINAFHSSIHDPKIHRQYSEQLAIVMQGDSYYPSHIS